MPEGETKTAYFNRTNSTLNSVCVKDIELDSITNISTDCDGDSETKVTCDGGVTEGYTCTLTDTIYKITGLEHSGNALPRVIYQARGRIHDLRPYPIHL